MRTSRFFLLSILQNQPNPALLQYNYKDSTWILVELSPSSFFLQNLWSVFFSLHLESLAFFCILNCFCDSQVNRLTSSPGWGRHPRHLQLSSDKQVSMCYIIYCSPREKWGILIYFLVYLSLCVSYFSKE